MAPEPEETYHSTAFLRITEREKIEKYIHGRSQGAGAAASPARKKIGSPKVGKI